MTVTLEPKTKVDVEKKALETLDKYEVNSLPVEPASLARRAGYRVDYEDLREDNFRGKLSADKKTIIIDSTIEEKSATRFIVAHEFGHAVYEHEGANYDESCSDTREAIADLFARALLMPRHYLERAVEIYSSKCGKSAFFSCEEYLSDMFGVTERRVKERLGECSIGTC